MDSNVAMDQTLLNGITIRKGQEISLTAKITGKPTPKVTWSHGNNDIKESDFVKVINTHSTTELIIKDSKLKNLCEYTCSVSNHYGTKHILPAKSSSLTNPTPLNVFNGRVAERRVPIPARDSLVLEANKYGIGQACETESVVVKNQFTVPRAPGKPKASGSTVDSITITWNRPAHDGDSEITDYQVLRRNKKILTGSEHKKHQFPNANFVLYEFRVAAINKAGVGPMSDTSDYYIASDPFYASSRPGASKVVTTTESTVQLR